MKKFALGLAAIAFAGAASAQVVIQGVQGTVTTVQNGTLVNVTNGMTLPEGAQLNFAPGAQITASFPGGCSAPMGPGSALTAAACQAIKTASGAGGAGGVGGGVGAGVGAGTTVLGMSLPVAIGAGALGLGALSQATQGNNTPPAISNQ